jgi:ribonuclease PH
MIIGSENKKDTRLEEIIKKLKSHEDLINEAQKGSVEINYAGNNVVVSVKVVV